LSDKLSERMMMVPLYYRFLDKVLGKKWGTINPPEQGQIIESKWEALEAGVENLREQMWKQVALKREVEAERDTLTKLNDHHSKGMGLLQIKLTETLVKLSSAETEVTRLDELTHTLDKAVKLAEDRAEKAEADVKMWKERSINQDLALIEQHDRLAKAHDWLSNTKPRLTELGTFVTSDEFYELKKALEG